MRAVDHVVRQFLEEPSEKRKIVINLGCDVDYAQLIVKKCDIIDQTNLFRQLLTSFKLSSPGDTITLRSDQYLAVACDLRDTEKLQKALAQELELENCLVLCTAEVSITYMDVEAADTLIRWAARFKDARFCLLEQFIPDGPEHPFAKTMIQHFDKLQTPLRCINKYPLLQDQQRRFVEAGWPSVAVRSLWDLWEDSQFLRSEERTALNSIEPFDEWEEFALFASHYFLLVATKSSEPNTSCGYIGPDQKPPVVYSIEEDAHRAVPRLQPSITLRYQDNPKGRGRRRFGAVMKSAENTVGYHGGLGTQTRLKTTDVYTDGEIHDFTWNSPPVSIAARMCHTITQLTRNDCLLVGGRTSPENALADCWLRRRQSWERVDDLPLGRYRHCATKVSNGNGSWGVLVGGGKDSVGTVLADYVLWRNEFGWQTVQVTRTAPRPRFGASMIAVDRLSGILLGGMTEDGVILSESWRWIIEDQDQNVKITFQDQSQPRVLSHVSECFQARFGASLEWSSLGLLYIGGVSDRGLIPWEYDIVAVGSGTCKVFAPEPGLYEASQFQRVDLACEGPRPLLVGHMVAIANGGELLVLGGGAVCFSFGTFWNLGTWTLQDSRDLLGTSWHLCNTVEVVPPLGPVVSATLQPAGNGHSHPSIPVLTPVGRARLTSPRAFEAIVTEAYPITMEGLDIGSCTKAWTIEYLKETVGAGRQVVVHEATTDHMSFQAKNFAYVIKAFGTFLDQVTNGQRQYLRSLATEKPADKAAKLSHDFPELAEDFNLPPELALVTENAHSSPLRISGPVAMWLHYDVMANVLCQIQGSKRVMLYPPSDVTRLRFPAGASSSVLNVFEATSATGDQLTNTHPYEAMLHPGDVLFIPACWPHTASPTDGVSIAVNVFFRDMKSGYAPGKDVYGNRDLQAYERGRLDVSKIAKAFEGLPMDIGRFYLERLADELKEKAHEFGSS
ncbi:MAG: tRNA methyltransferase ppm2 [Pleopsidium flavum]|nr:MAG: tRNA methyltransferase ppm2 [Pleopsidium flavum]